jgi:hypothetical protein
VWLHDGRLYSLGARATSDVCRARAAPLREAYLHAGPLECEFAHADGAPNPREPTAHPAGSSKRQVIDRRVVSNPNMALGQVRYGARNPAYDLESSAVVAASSCPSAGLGRDWPSLYRGGSNE